ncbi:hypothetical protein HG531_008689 [Fusarium graminearum]|nr:hypothetical protein HG531_008689 [Fusarium graminearum]
MCQLAASSQLVSVLEHDERNQAENSTKNGKDETSILTSDIVEKSISEQRRNSTEGVSHETLSSNGRRRTLTVAIGSVTVCALKHKVDTESDGGETNGRADPRDVRVLGEAVDEETNGEEHGSIHGSVETGFGSDLDVGVGDKTVKLAHLEVVSQPAEGGTNAERDVGETGDTLTPAMVLLESDGDDREEEEDDSPAESNPETKGKDDRLSYEHVNSLDGTGLEHSLQTGSQNVASRDVSFITGRLSKSLGALVESDATTGLREVEEDDEQQGNVGDTLDTLNPSPSERLVDETCVDGSADSSEDGDPAEHGHGATSVVRLVHVVKSSSDENGTDTAEKTKQESKSDNGVDVLGEGEADK